MAKKSTSKAQQARAQAYKTNNTCAKNRKRKLERHLKKYPNDVTASVALKKGPGYRRKKPNNSKLWTRQKKEYAHLLKTLGYNGNMIGLHDRNL